MSENTQLKIFGNSLGYPQFTDYFEKVEKFKVEIIPKIYEKVMEEQDMNNLVEATEELAKRRTDHQAGIDFETKLERELAEIKRKQFVEEKVRQQLRETNHDLKELEKKLRTAYATKALMEQLADKKSLRLQEKQLQHKEIELMEQARGKEEDRLKEERENEAKRKILHREELQKQIYSKCQAKATQLEDFIKEKKIIDEIVRKLDEEQLEEMKGKLARQLQYREDMDKFIETQKIWQERKQLQTEEEDRSLKEYLEKREVKIKEMEDKKRLEDLKKGEISKRIGMELSLLNEEKRKRQELLLDLQVEEWRENDERKLREQLEKQLRHQIEIRVELDRQKEDLIRRKNEAHEAEKKFREDQMRFFAERDKLDQLSDEKRRKKILEHRKETQLCLEQRKLRHAEEIANIIKERDEEIRDEERRQQIVEEERIRILKEHAGALMGYLPPGILRESDREFLSLPSKN